MECCNICVKLIDNKDAYPFLLNIHYAKRIRYRRYAFGLFVESLLVGVVTYGTPAGNTLRIGVAGKENSKHVIELNRLCITSTLKNAASILVGRSLDMLPKPSIVVSFADISQGHTGYVYQACNFIYTGLSAKRTDWAIKGMEYLHGQTISDMSRHVAITNRGDRAKFMRDTYGDKFYLKERPRKHRYIFITGNKFQKKYFLSQLKYSSEPYPKRISGTIVERIPILTKDVGSFDF